MAEYIKKEAALEIINSLNIASALYAGRKIINLPPADVAPVRHAMWEVVVGSDGKEHMVCTGCRKQQDLTGVFSYCPNCGARMDGDTDA